MLLVDADAVAPLPGLGQVGGLLSFTGIQFRGTSCSCSLGPFSNLILLNLLPSSVVGTFTHW